MGAGHIRAVRELADAWETALQNKHVALAVIQGPTGIGKTAVVRGLYEQLAMRQSRPAYWPATFTAVSAAEAERAITRLGAAKRIYPEKMKPEPGSVMEFLWWGWTAEAGRSAVLGADFQLKIHQQVVAAAIERGDRLIRDRLTVALSGLTLLASLGALGPVLGTVLGDIDDYRTGIEVLRSVPDLLQSKTGLLDRARRRNSGTVFSVTDRSQAEAAAENDAQSLGLTASVLPVIIAVEDAQFLDRVSVSLLRRLCRQPNAAGLIVMTVDTDQPAADNAQTDWLNARNWPERPGRQVRLQIPPLSGAELTEMAVAELGAEVDRDNLAHVINRAAGVPGALFDMLDTPAVAKMLRSGEAGLASLATISPAEGIQAAFAAARAPLRQALAAASVHGQMTVRGWLPDRANTDAAIEDRWLLERPRTDVVEFASSRLLDVVRAAQNRELTPAEIRGLRTGLQEAITRAQADGSWDDLDADVRESVLASLVEEDAEPSASLTAELFDLRRATGRAAADEEFLDEITERLASGRPQPRVLVAATAEALFDEGRLDQALQLLSKDLDQVRSQYGDNDPRTWPALHNLAAAHAAAAQARHGRPESAPHYQTALRLYGELLNWRVNARPADPWRVIATRAQYAELLADCYRYPEAITQGETLIRELISSQGPNHRNTLSTRGTVALWRARAGDSSRAAGELGALIPDLTSVLGAQDLLTLDTRRNWAGVLGGAGFPDQAVAELEKLLAEHVLLLGRYHPASMSTKFGLAYARENAGDDSGAIALYEQVLADRTQVLGPDDPDTLKTRGNLAYCRGMEGDTAGAIAAFETLVVDYDRVLGPDHESTLTGRGNVAYWRGKAGQYAEAIAAYEQLIDDRVRVLGPDDPATLKSRLGLARMRGEAGHPAVAVAALDELVKDEMRVHGLIHPDTAGAMSEYMRWATQLRNAKPGSTA